MKKLLSLLFCFAVVIGAYAQDVIVKKDGGTILAKVESVTPNEVEYKKPSNPNGPTYTISISELISVNYENGEKDVFSEPVIPADTQNTTPFLTQETTSNYSKDNELKKLYYTLNNDEKTWRKKGKTLKLTGIIGGLAIMGGGLAIILCEDFPLDDPNSNFIIGGCCIGVGAVAGLTCFLIGNNYTRKANKLRLDTASVWNKDYQLGQNTSLNWGVDLLNDNYTHSQAIGMGLRLNF